MLININAARCIGIDAESVTVEIDISNGIGIHLVGLADAAVKESLLRTITALNASGFRVPGRKIVINLAPADVHKKGGGYDLPIALGIIAASDQVSLPGLGKYMIMGELGLDGSVRDVPGALPIAELAARKGLSGCILPLGSALQVAEVEGLDIFAVRDIHEALLVLQEEDDPSDLLIFNRAREILAGGTGSGRADGRTGAGPAPCPESAAGPSSRSLRNDALDFADIVGQDGAKRGLEIAAAGGHNVIMVGAPGSGKSSLAKALPGILPPMTKKESIVVSKIYSVAGKAVDEYGLMKRRPFRAPHYSSSLPAILGGGSGDNIMPGEVSLAQSGVLFIDEYMQMPKSVAEALRGPLEDRVVTISRLRSKVQYPASFMLVAAANPCPCGYYGEGERCTCSVGARMNYMSRLSGPVLDRIDLQLWLHSVDPSRLVRRTRREESSAEVSLRVKKARDIQLQRFSALPITTNSEMNSEQLKEFCPLDKDCMDLLEKAMKRMGLSARAYARILKIARTIADLEGKTQIEVSHVSEAISYRFLDKVM
ncbi:MAG: YifB family Mg chelatase-like AAA ATPase [Bacteroidales bacterium]|nr:YifB family Mg chelatase-like AAA ATPase [Bacteroidales bacterium]